MKDLAMYAMALRVLVDEWHAPLRCRPYTRLETLEDGLEVHRGYDHNWTLKTRSIMTPKVKVFMLFA